MTIGPDRVEVGVRVDRSARVIMIVLALVGHWTFQCPGFTIITAYPQADFTAGVIRLWTDSCRTDDAPYSVFTGKRRSIVVIVVGVVCLFFKTQFV